MKPIIVGITMSLLFVAPCVVVAQGNAASGEKVFATKCKSCHGSQGAGNAAIAKSLGVTFRDLKSAEVQKLTDAELKKLALGGHGKKKALKNVSATEADDAVAFLRKLK
jgi:mono/diheme cytochrome c family protein